MISIRVDGYPPAKGEARSMLGEHHSHAPRVRRLLDAAAAALAVDGAEPFGRLAIELEMILHCRGGHGRGDATNYLGGIVDVLENKSHRAGQLDHLGDLRKVHLYDDDRQIEAITFLWEPASDPSYELTFRSL